MKGPHPSATSPDTWAPRGDAHVSGNVKGLCDTVTLLGFCLHDFLCRGVAAAGVTR